MTNVDVNTEFWKGKVTEYVADTSNRCIVSLEQILEKFLDYKRLALKPNSYCINVSVRKCPENCNNSFVENVMPCFLGFFDQFKV